MADAHCGIPEVLTLISGIIMLLVMEMRSGKSTESQTPSKFMFNYLGGNLKPEEYDSGTHCGLEF